jgi:tetratricopeptide (TPR) repeat protein
MGRPDKALPALERATEQDPTLLEARAELGYLYFRAGDPEKGMQIISDARLRLRQFGWSDFGPTIGQRVTNETATLVEYLNTLLHAP